MIETESSDPEEIITSVSLYLEDNMNFEPRSLVADVNYLEHLGGATQVFFKVA